MNKKILLANLIAVLLSTKVSFAGSNSKEWFPTLTRGEFASACTVGLCSGLSASKYLIEAEDVPASVKLVASYAITAVSAVYVFPKWYSLCKDFGSCIFKVRKDKN